MHCVKITWLLKIVIPHSLKVKLTYMYRLINLHNFGTKETCTHIYIYIYIYIYINNLEHILLFISWFLYIWKQVNHSTTLQSRANKTNHVKKTKGEKTKLKQQKEQQDLIKFCRVVGLHHTIFAFCFTFSWIHELLILSQHVALSPCMYVMSVSTSTHFETCEKSMGVGTPTVQLCCLTSLDVSWHVRDKLRPMLKNGSI